MLGCLPIVVLLVRVTMSCSFESMSFVRSDELGFGPDPVGDELVLVPDMLFFKRRRVTSPILGKLRIEISPKGRSVLR